MASRGVVPVGDSGRLRTVLLDKSTLDFLVSCRDCGRNSSMPRDWAGGKVRCPQCRQRLVLPLDSGRLTRLQAPPEAGTGFGPVRRRNPSASFSVHDRDLTSERHVQGLGSFYQLAAIAVAVTGLAQGATAPLVGGLLAALGLLGIGHALTLLQPWARVLSIFANGVAVVATGALVWNWVGVSQLMMMAAVLTMSATGGWLLLSPRGSAVFAPEYEVVLRRTARQAKVDWWRSPYFWLQTVLLGLLSTLALF